MRTQCIPMGKDKFVTSAVLQHGDTYDYSLVQYINCDTPVDIICPVHGAFKQRPYLHSRGAGCKKCADLKNSEIRKKSDFVERATILHQGKYNYDKSVYIGAREKLIVICPTHGDFELTPTNHLRGKGCKECHFDKLRTIYNLTTEEFIARANLTHDYYYDYSKVQYEKCDKRVTIVCPVHGEFEQSPAQHWNGSGCRKCSSSIGEKLVRKVLTHLSVEFAEQQIFHDCRNINCLPFDFYLPKYNVCIEYDGIQHYEPVEFFGGQERFEERQKIDTVKTQYCQNNNIRLIRISYKERVTKELILSKLNSII